MAAPTTAVAEAAAPPATLFEAESVKEVASRVSSAVTGAVTVQMIHLGDSLGLYKALKAHGPLTPAQLAAHTKLHER